jgi:hypothetical protein
MALMMLGLEWVLGARETDDEWKARESAYVATESEYQL